MDKDELGGGVEWYLESSLQLFKLAIILGNALFSTEIGKDFFFFKISGGHTKKTFCVSDASSYAHLRKLLLSNLHKKVFF